MPNLLKAYSLAVIFIENWSEVFVWLPIAVAVFLDGKFEKADELAKQYIARANSICMWTLFAVLGIFAMAVKYHAISLSALMIVIFGGLALRSILFLCFDMLPPGSKEDSDA